MKRWIEVDCELVEEVFCRCPIHGALVQLGPVDALIAIWYVHFHSEKLKTYCCSTPLIGVASQSQREGSYAVSLVSGSAENPEIRNGELGSEDHIHFAETRRESRELKMRTGWISDGGNREAAERTQVSVQGRKEGGALKLPWVAPVGVSEMYACETSCGGLEVAWNDHEG